MPTLSVFYGIVVQMFWRDHNPPHFHVRYLGYRAMVDIRGLRIMKGALPKREKDLVLTWASAHQGELMEAWKACSRNVPPKQIAPLT